MAEPLSYLSTLEEVISTSDEDLRQGFGHLAPETVMNYVFHLRNQNRTLERGKQVAEAEVVQLKKLVSEKDESLAGFMSALGVGEVPASAPPGYDMSVPTVPTVPAVSTKSSVSYNSASSSPSSHSGSASANPSSNSASPSYHPASSSGVPNLTYTGYSQEPSISSKPAGQPSPNLTPNSPQIANIHQAKLQRGFVINATFVYRCRTEKFSLNLTKSYPKFNIFHLDFRPNPHGNVIVMNTNPDKGWEKEVRAELPQLMNGKMFNVTVECQQSMFRVKVNNQYIDSSFPYRYPLEDVSCIRLAHGSNGNKWIALSWGPSSPEQSLGITDTKKFSPGEASITSGKSTSDISRVTHDIPPVSEVENLGNTTFKPGMKLEAKALFVRGTGKFTINLMKTDGFYIFHLDFRPGVPHGNVIVMNTNPNKNWEREVRAELPKLRDEQVMVVVIECGEREFRVKVNDVNIGSAFPYRYPLQDVKRIKVRHGTNGNRWVSLSIVHPVQELKFYNEKYVGTYL